MWSSTVITKQTHDWEILVLKTMKLKGCSIRQSRSIWKMGFVLFRLQIFFTVFRFMISIPILRIRKCLVLAVSS